MDNLVPGREAVERDHGAQTFTASHLSQLVMERDPSLSSSRLELIREMLTEGRDESIAFQGNLSRYSSSAPDQRPRTDTHQQQNSEFQSGQSSYDRAGSNWGSNTVDIMFDSVYPREESSLNAIANWRAMNSLTAGTMPPERRLRSRTASRRTSSHQGESEFLSQGLHCD